MKSKSHISQLSGPLQTVLNVLKGEYNVNFLHLCMHYDGVTKPEILLDIDSVPLKPSESQDKRLDEFIPSLESLLQEISKGSPYSMKFNLVYDDKACSYSLISPYRGYELIGESECILDDRGRLRLPVKFREKIAPIKIVYLWQYNPDRAYASLVRYFKGQQPFREAGELKMCEEVCFDNLYRLILTQFGFKKGDKVKVSARQTEYLIIDRLV